MNKINFKQPKYIIPIIILPFLFFGFYYGQDLFAAESPKIPELDTSNSINSTVPTTEISDSRIDGKFTALLNKFKSNTDITLMKKIEDDEDSIYNSSRYNSLLADKLLDDTPNNVDFVYKKPISKTKRKHKRQSSYKDNSVGELTDFISDVEASANAKHSGSEEQTETVSSDTPPSKVNVTKISNVRLSHFNTITSRSQHLLISAIIDENFKVVKKSRVTIRLMEDINIGHQLLKKGAYIYGIVDNFKQQRLFIHISFITLDSQIIPVNLDVYDDDGMEGLYIPNSSFRDFSNDFGSRSSRQNVNFDEPDSEQEMFFGLIDKAINSSSKAISKSLKKQKANLKYNTIIYLVDPEQFKN